MLTFGIFGTTIEIDLRALATGGLKVLLIVAIALIAMLIVRRVVPKIIRMRMPKLGRKQTEERNEQRVATVSRMLIRACNIVIVIVALIMVLEVFGINTTAVLATVGVASIGIGFAAQNIIRDYMNGAFIVMEDWYREGEVATCAGITGVVQKVLLRRTELRDLDGKLHVIPNSLIDKTSNYSRDWARINLDIPVAYSENLDRCISVINEVCKGFKEDEKWGPQMITTPEVLRVNNLGDSGIDIKILGDTKPLQQWALMGELRKRIKDRFDVEGIEIPWPHTKVYFGNDMASAAATN
ncbi:mechanosensitive ion channel family protein [Chloroflexota bacterium]